MAGEEFTRIIDESIKVEEGMAALYGFFTQAFQEDKAFWAQLAQEEREHAKLILTERENFIEELFPHEMFSAKLKPLVAMNKTLRQWLDDYRKNLPSREDALQTALQFEFSAGEVHFQKGMDEGNPSIALKLFQELNRRDKDHAQRIQDYMRSCGFEPQ